MAALCACAFGVKKLRTDCCLFELFSGLLLELMLMHLNCTHKRLVLIRPSNWGGPPKVTNSRLCSVAAYMAMHTFQKPTASFQVLHGMRHASQPIALCVPFHPAELDHSYKRSVIVVP